MGLLISLASSIRSAVGIKWSYKFALSDEKCKKFNFRYMYELKFRLSLR